jgi:hypothetical protein
MKCNLCGKDFGSNKTNYDRHVGSKEHLGRLFRKPNTVVVSKPKEVEVVGVPPTNDQGGAMVIPQHNEPLPVPHQYPDLPIQSNCFRGPTSQTNINWKKFALVAGAILLFLYVLDSATRPRNAAPVNPTTLDGVRGNLQGAIPASLMGIVGIVMLSKLLRGELGGWIKILNDWAK